MSVEITNSNGTEQDLDPASLLDTFNEQNGNQTGDMPNENQIDSKSNNEPAADGSTNGDDQGKGNEQDPNGNQTDNNTPNDTEPKSFDLNKYFEERSEGLIKSEEDFQASLQKIKDFSTLEQQIEVLKSEKESTFANDFIKTLNNLHKEGKSQEQIDSFVKLSKTDVNTIDSREVLIQKMILKDGHTRELAERFIDRQYGLDKIDINDPLLTEDEKAELEIDLKLIQVKLDQDAKPVREDFNQELESIKNAVSPEQRALDEAAKKLAYEKALEPFAAQLSSEFPKKLEVALGDKDGEALVYDYPAEFIQSIQEEAKIYFNHPDIEVNAGTVKEFVSLKQALFLRDNFEKIAKDVFNQGKSLATKETVQSYENNYGVRDHEDPNQVEITANQHDYLMELATK